MGQVLYNLALAVIAEGQSHTCTCIIIHGLLVECIVEDCVTELFRENATSVYNSLSSRSCSRKSCRMALRRSSHKPGQLLTNVCDCIIFLTAYICQPANFERTYLTHKYSLTIIIITLLLLKDKKTCVQSVNSWLLVVPRPLLLLWRTIFDKSRGNTMHTMVLHAAFWLA